MKTMTLEEFHAAFKAQGVQSRNDIAVVCPMCKTVQSARDFIAADVGQDFESVDKYLGFSWIGRFTGASSSRRAPDGDPCDWTLGGLCQPGLSGPSSNAAQGAGFGAAQLPHLHLLRQEPVGVQWTGWPRVSASQR